MILPSGLHVTLAPWEKPVADLIPSEGAGKPSSFFDLDTPGTFDDLYNGQLGASRSAKAPTPKPAAPMVEIGEDGFPIPPADDFMPTAPDPFTDEENHA